MTAYTEKLQSEGADEEVNPGAQVEVPETEVAMKSADTKVVQSSNDDGRQSKRRNNINEIMEPWSTAWKSLKSQIHQVFYGNEGTTTDQVEKKQKRLSNYSQKTLWFAILVFLAYLIQQYTSPSFPIGGTLFFVVFLIFHLALTLLLPTNWGHAFICLSWLLEELASCLLVLSYNRYYAFAIPLVLLLIVLAALLQLKLQHVVTEHVLSLYDGNTVASEIPQDVSDQESQHLDHLFEISQGIANCGSLVTAILGHFMVGPVNAIGFFFYCTVALALYLMMLITMRAVSRTHAACLFFLLMILLAVMLGTTSVAVVLHSSKVAKSSNHRKMLVML